MYIYVYVLQGRPFHFSFFVSNSLTLHPTQAIKVEEMLKNHTGKLLHPPDSYERLQELGPFEEKIYEVYNI